jgi:hypothetical protein
MQILLQDEVSSAQIVLARSRNVTILTFKIKATSADIVKFFYCGKE